MGGGREGEGRGVTWEEAEWMKVGGVTWEEAERMKVTC